MLAMAQALSSYNKGIQLPEEVERTVSRLQRLFRETEESEDNEDEF